jgi:hypothetical protein
LWYPFSVYSFVVYVFYPTPINSRPCWYIHIKWSIYHPEVIEEIMFFKKSAVTVAIFCVIVHLGCSSDTNPTSPASLKTVVTTHHLNNSNSSQIVSLAIGDTFDITLQTIGPGMYGTPAISNSGIQFLSVSLTPFPIPAGPTQIYLFRSTSNGNADISIIHSENNSANSTFTLSCKVQ